MDAGLLPVKRLSDAKRRLGAEFGDVQRVQIARALLDDALDLCRCTGRLRWWVVTADDHVVAAARRHGLDVFNDETGDLNVAVAGAMHAVLVAGAASATVLPCDLPLALPEDVEDVLDTGATSDMVVVPSRRDGGTNALYMSPPGVGPPRFGTGSLSAHVALAERARLRCSILPLPRLALDIDTVEDVDELLGVDGAQRSRAARMLRRLRSPAPT
ncbi:MAG: 2-phospho-L-lactate guanylyltransferase [Actinomycetota bacterium]